MEELYRVPGTPVFCSRLDGLCTMTTLLEQITPADVGNRLRIARESARMTQADAAAAIDIARTTLVAIEKGQRRVRMNELQQLSRLYGMTVNALLRQEAVHVDLAPRFRRLPDSSDSAADAAVQLLSDLARAEVELESLLGVKRSRNYPPERPDRKSTRLNSSH